MEAVVHAQRLGIPEGSAFLAGSEHAWMDRRLSFLPNSVFITWTPVPGSLVISIAADCFLSGGNLRLQRAFLKNGAQKGRKGVLTLHSDEGRS